VGFSQTNSHLGLGQSGFEHFQSQLGSAQTDSHSGLGDWQWVTQCGALQTFTHLGQSVISQALSGHIGVQSGLKFQFLLNFYGIFNGIFNGIYLWNIYGIFGFIVNYFI
jgi:hypothetical protein